MVDADTAGVRFFGDTASFASDRMSIGPVDVFGEAALARFAVSCTLAKGLVHDGCDGSPEDAFTTIGESAAAIGDAGSDRPFDLTLPCEGGTLGSLRLLGLRLGLRVGLRLGLIGGLDDLTPRVGETEVNPPTVFVGLVVFGRGTERLTDLRILAGVI